MNKEYIEINKNAYEILANEYNTRNYKIGYDFWNNIYDDLNLKNKFDGRYDGLTECLPSFLSGVSGAEEHQIEEFPQF